MGTSDNSSEIGFHSNPNTLLGTSELAVCSCLVMALSCGLFVTHALRLKCVSERSDLASV